MATSAETAVILTPGCPLCESELAKLMKPSSGIAEQEECDTNCDEDSCIEGCRCGQCICDEECWLHDEGCDDDDSASEFVCVDTCLCADCIEAKVHSNRWDSLYANGLGPIGGVRGWQVDYEMCSPGELKKMICDRGLVDPYPQGTTMKYAYVRTLTNADRSPLTFRFLDLWPELRNLVYGELLRLPTASCPRHHFCFPQILRTSRQVHKEAKELLYTESTIKCVFATHCTPSGSLTLSVLNNELMENGHCPCGCDFDFMNPVHTEIPRFLQRIHFLDIIVDLRCHHASLQPSSPVRRSILLLASAIMDQNCLEKLTILVESGHEADDHGDIAEWIGIANILQPLRRLRNIPKVVVSGKVDAATASGIVEDAQGNEPTFNTIKQLQLISAEANAYEEWVARLPDDDSEGPPDKAVMRETIPDQFSQIQAAVDPDMGLVAFTDEDSELEMQIRLAKLKECLDEVVSDKAHAPPKKLLDARKTRTAYAAKTTKTLSIDFETLARAETPPPLFED